jgi:hypothetical protein
LVVGDIHILSISLVVIETKGITFFLSITPEMDLLLELFHYEFHLFFVESISVLIDCTPTRSRLV